MNVHYLIYFHPLRWINIWKDSLYETQSISLMENVHFLSIVKHFEWIQGNVFVVFISSSHPRKGVIPKRE
jgi:hypothetical protein